MEIIPDGPTEATAVELCQAVAQLLDRHALVSSYNPRLDWDYRRWRRALLDRLSGEPCLTRHAATAAALFPPSLEKLDTFDRAMRAYGAPRIGNRWRHPDPDSGPAALTDDDRRRWWLHPDGGRAKLAALQSRLLTALDRAGLPAFRDGPPLPEPNPRSPAVAPPPPPVPSPAEQARARAREFRASGMTIKEIALRVERSERRVNDYLK